MSDDIVKTLLESLTDEQRAELVRVMTKGLLKSKEQEETIEGTVPSKPRSKVTEDFKVDRETKDRKTPVRARKNKWVDEGENRDPDFSSENFEKLGRTPRNRQPVKKKQVECHICGRSFAINQSLVYGEFVRCNRCTGR